MNDYDGYITGGENEAVMTFTVGYTTEDFRVTITDANGCTTSCEIQLACEPVFVPLLDEGGETTVGQDFSLFPNPARNEVFLQISNPEDLSGNLVLMDAFGNKVHEQHYGIVPSGKLRIDTAQLPAGVYFTSLRLDGKQPVSSQFVIVK